MRNILVLLSFFAFILADDVSKSFRVEGMVCDYGCVKKIKEVVNSLEGVKTCEVDFRQSKLTVSFDADKLNSDNIIESLTEETIFKTSKLEDQKKSFWSKLKGLFRGKS